MKLNLFSNDKKLKKAFKTIKIDMENLEKNHEEVKSSTDEWMRFLMEENSFLKLRIEELEMQKQAPVSKRQEEPEIDMLRDF